MKNKFISLVLALTLLYQQSGLIYAAGEINLANYLSQAKSAIVQPDVFQPPRLRCISYDAASNDFKLLLDKGDTLKGLSPKGTVPEKDELFNYFLIGLALPNDVFWVNLRPDAPENIIDPLLEKTDIGKIFLEADLQLKKDTASLTSPQNPEGKKYWDKLYKKAGELFPAAGGSAFGGENITIPTITRPWIVPNEVIVRETEDSAYIYKATLKVMLEADYLIGRGGSRTAPTPEQYAFSDPRLKELNEYSSRIIRETIVPKLTREVNSSQRYAKLRQVYYSLVLARWFKQKYQGRFSGGKRLLERTVPGIDSRDLTNLTSQEPCDKQTYFQAYQKSFKEGEYNLKETVAAPFGQNIRSYISGGINVGKLPVNKIYVGISSEKVTGALMSSGSPLTFFQRMILNAATIVLSGGYVDEEILNVSKDKSPTLQHYINSNKNGDKDGLKILVEKAAAGKRSISRETARDLINAWRSYFIEVVKKIAGLPEETAYKIVCKVKGEPQGHYDRMEAYVDTVTKKFIQGLEDKDEDENAYIRSIELFELSKAWMVFKNAGKDSKASGSLIEIAFGDGKTPEMGNRQMPIAGLTVKSVISRAEKAMNVFLSSLADREVLWKLSPQGRKIDQGQMIKDKFAELAKAKSVPETLEGIESLVRKLNNIKESYIKSLDADSIDKDGLSLSYTVMVLNLIALLNQAGWGALDANKSDLPEAPNGGSTGSPLTVEDVGNMKIELRKYAEMLASFYDGLSSVDLTNGVEQRSFGKDYKNYSRDLVGTLNPKELIDGVRTAIRLTIDKRPPDYTVKKWQKILVNLEWIENRIGLTLEKYAAELNELFGDKEEALYKYFSYMEKGELASYRQKYGQPGELKNIATAIEAANIAAALYKGNNIDVREKWEMVAAVLREIDSVSGQWLGNIRKVRGSLAALKWSIEKWYKELSDDTRNKWLSNIRQEMENVLLPGLTNIQEDISKYDPIKSVLAVIDAYVKELEENRISSQTDLNAFVEQRVIVYMIVEIDFYLARYQGYGGIIGLHRENTNELNKILNAFKDEMIGVTKVSSALIRGRQEPDVLVKTKIDSPGGIDLTDRFMRLKIERTGSFADLKLFLPQVQNAQGLDLDKEFRQIEAIASSGIVPNSRRILELFSSCYSRGEFGKRLPQVISCLKASSAIQEKLAIDSDDDFRLCLLLPDIFSDGG